MVDENAVDVEVRAGESVLMHNWLVHSSGTNPSDKARKAFSVNYLDARTRVLDPLPRIMPENVPSPAGGTMPQGFRFQALFGGAQAAY